MRNDIKELTDSMERGWKLAPKTSFMWFTHIDGGPHHPSIKVNEVKAACAMGHALLGQNTTNLNHLSKLFPVLNTQQVEIPIEKDDTMSLYSAINDLILDYNWSTPKVIKWLRSHQND